MEICLAQLNPTVGDLLGNAKRIKETVRSNPGADLIVFSELFLTGFPPKDLLLRPGFLAESKEVFTDLLKFSRMHPRPAVIFGLPWEEGGKLFNSAVVIKNGKILGIQHKRQLSRLVLFDEHKYFSPGTALNPLTLKDGTVAVFIGEELGPAVEKNGAALLINLTAVPFQAGQVKPRQQRLQETAAYLKTPILWVNQAGANDELIFYGRSLAADSAGNLKALLPDFQTAALSFTFNSGGNAAEREENEVGQIYQALVLGLRDYVRKSGMAKVIIGLSGGLDSALSAVIAAAALGPENVWGITMPGPHSPSHSAGDAEALARNLGIRFDTIPIGPLYDAYLQSLAAQFAGTAFNVAEENIQARARGSLLMALANKFGGLVLTNSNKSELAVGYCTLYGDMSGGLAPLGDVYKTTVYKLAHYINRAKEIIPRSTIEKPPSAELRPNQRDDDSLPPYETLDAIIAAYLDQNLSREEIIAKGFSSDLVDWALGIIDRSDFKRRQAATILRVTSPVFGYERQMPLAGKK